MGRGVSGRVLRSTLLLDKLDDFRSRKGPAVKESLHRLTAMVTEESKLLLRLHSFGDHSQFEAVRHGDNCRGNRRIIGVGGYLPDKRLVDFQGIEGEAFQIAE